MKWKLGEENDSLNTNEVSKAAKNRQALFNQGKHLARRARKNFYQFCWW